MRWRGGGGRLVIFMHCSNSRMAIDHRIPILLGLNTSGLFPTGEALLARIVKRLEMFGKEHEG